MVVTCASCGGPCRGHLYTCMDCGVIGGHLDVDHPVAAAMSAYMAELHETAMEHIRNDLFVAKFGQH